jgi:hypothetical protein
MRKLFLVLAGRLPLEIVILTLRPLPDRNSNTEGITN